MISVEGWLFISMVGTLFFWGAVIGILGMFAKEGGSGDHPPHFQQPGFHSLDLEQWGRDLWRTP